MTIESKDFFATLSWVVFFIGNHAFMESRHRAESSSGVEWMRGTVYNEREILGGFADEI